MAKTIDEKYLQLIDDIYKFGVDFEGRNGGTRAIIDRPVFIAWNAENDCFPIIAIRKQNIKHYINEFLWEINGGCNVNDLNGKYYRDVDSRFLWEPWAGEDGLIPYSYGACWRANGEILANHSVDQLKMLEDMLDKDPTSRRLTLITADVAKNAICIDPGLGFGDPYPPQVPPCHPCITFTSDGKYLNAHVHSRSQDVVCGLPGDMIRYHLMVQCLSFVHYLIPGNIWFSFSNIHYYKEHETKLMKIIDNYESNDNNEPMMILDNTHQRSLLDFDYDEFHLHNYHPRKFVSFPLVV